MNRWLCRLFLLVALFCPAPAPGADEKPAATAYYPLKVGNTWQYRVGENRFTMKVAKMEEIKVAGANGKETKVECARLEQIVNNKVVSFEHIAVTADAVLRYTTEGKSVNPPIPFLKLPPRKGATWDFEAKIDGQLAKGKFIEGEEVVKVPAGTYKAVSVATSDDTEVNGVKVKLTYYFAEKVGLVKEVIEFAGEKAVIELEKFEQGK
jgi:hypothetical protein